MLHFIKLDFYDGFAHAGFLCWICLCWIFISGIYRGERPVRTWKRKMPRLIDFLISSTFSFMTLLVAMAMRILLKAYQFKARLGSLRYIFVFSNIT